MRMSTRTPVFRRVHFFLSYPFKYVRHIKHHAPTHLDTWDFPPLANPCIDRKDTNAQITCKSFLAQEAFVRRRYIHCTIGLYKNEPLYRNPFGFKRDYSFHPVVCPCRIACNCFKVAKTLSAKQRDAGADTSALEREIDELVYALYGLTAEEIKLVEGAAK
jgi:hypothetical protein